MCAGVESCVHVVVSCVHKLYHGCGSIDTSHELNSAGNWEGYIIMLMLHMRPIEMAWTAAGQPPVWRLF